MEEIGPQAPPGAEELVEEKQEIEEIGPQAPPGAEELVEEKEEIEEIGPRVPPRGRPRVVWPGSPVFCTE